MIEPNEKQLERLKEIAYSVDFKHRSALHVRASMLDACLTVWREAQEETQRLLSDLPRAVEAIEADILTEQGTTIKMLREQIRVSDLAFQNEFDMRTESNKLVQQLEASLKLAVRDLKQITRCTCSDSYIHPRHYAYCAVVSTNTTLDHIRTNHPSLL